MRRGFGGGGGLPNAAYSGGSFTFNMAASPDSYVYFQRGGTTWSAIGGYPGIGQLDSCLWLGLNGAVPSNTNMVMYSNGSAVTVNAPSGNGQLTVAAGAAVLAWTSTQLQTSAPMVGDGSASPHAMSGYVAVAEGNADFTESATNYAMRYIEYTGAMTAGHTITYPTPSAVYAYYEKTLFNNTSGGFAITFKCGAGATIAIAAGKKAILGFKSTGDVVRITADT